ncbi:MAG: SDR family oxidoreductase, partial [Methylococcales bacterium]
GCNTVIASRSPERVERMAASLANGVGFPDCNVRDSKCITSLFEFVDAKYGRLDILITSAGIGRGESAPGFKPDEVAFLNETEWDEVIDTNLKGVYLAAKKAASYMLTRRRGQIINISSARGAVRGHAYGASYCASKMAARALFESMAAELGPYGIRVLSFMPDAVDTDLIRGSRLANRGAITPEQIGKIVADALVIPMDTMLINLFILPIGAGIQHPLPINQKAKAS